MDATNSLLCQVAITMTSKLNNKLAFPLFERCGGVEGFFHESKNALQILMEEFHWKNIEIKQKEWLDLAKKESDIMQKEEIACCFIEDMEYPPLLKHCEDAPLVLFYKGRLTISGDKTIAIVGTRKASERCKNRMDFIIEQIAGMGYRPLVVSGLAYGIDITAHKACLRHNLITRAVLGHGLHMVYPSRHKEIADRIISQGGALISEFPTCAPILPINFLQRNRIIAGMSEAVLVAESAIKGGAMATARQALSYNREVMALPGRPEDLLSSGCNLLIKENIAALVEHVDDILKIIHWENRPSLSRQTSLPFLGETDMEKTIKRHLAGEGPQDIDRLHVSTGIPIPTLSSLLLKLELEGIISRLPGKNYMLL